MLLVDALRAISLKFPTLLVLPGPITIDVNGCGVIGCCGLELKIVNN